MFTILCEHRTSPMKLEVMGVFDWPVRKKEVSTFSWTCKRQETCYFVRGKAIVTPESEESQVFERGDLVTFPVGAYTWEVIKSVEMHYNLD